MLRINMFASIAADAAVAFLFIVLLPQRPASDPF